MKKLLILSILIFGFQTHGLAQKLSVWGGLSRASSKITSFCNRTLKRCIPLNYMSTSSTLAKRQARAYLRAATAILGQSDTAMKINDFTDVFTKDDVNDGPYLELYRKINPDGVVLQTDKQAMNHLLASINRSTALGVTETEKVASKLQDSFPLLLDHLKTYTHPEEEDISWLAQQIPQDTQYLLLGEMHVPVINDAVKDLIPYLRARFGERRIILLTEFLEEGDTSELDDPEKYAYFNSRQHIYDAAKENDISVLGLEPTVVFEHHEDFYFTTDLNEKINLWQSLFGIRVRNRLWSNTIERVRRENPDALIIVYAGFSHLSYVVPFSIGKELKQYAPTFVASFVLGIPDLEPGKFEPVSPFDSGTDGLFPQRVLRFEPGDAEITGFDVQLKVRGK